MLGYQPPPTHVSDQVIVGNPLNPEDGWQHEDSGARTCGCSPPARWASWRAPRAALVADTDGYYPLPPRLARLAARVDPSALRVRGRDLRRSLANGRLADMGRHGRYTRGRTSSSSAGPDPAKLMDLLGLSEEELCTILDADALTLLSGQLDHRPELKILLELLAEPEEQTGQDDPPPLGSRNRTHGEADRSPGRTRLPGVRADVAQLNERGFLLRQAGA